MRHLEKVRFGDSAMSALSAFAFIVCMMMISLAVWSLLGMLLQV